MELKAGYKQTEVGVIPADWDAKPIRSVLSRGSLGGNYPNQEVETDSPLMKMGNIARGNFDLTKVEYIAISTAPQCAHRLAYGDVLFNTRNTLDLVGKVAIWRNELPVAYYNSNLMRLEFDKCEVSSSEYANYALNASGSLSRLRAIATGTTSVAAIYTRDLLELLLPIPPLSEQSAIATALSDVDALLDGLTRLIAKKRDLKQAAMQQLLTGQTRLPGFYGEWESVELGDVASIRNVKVVASSTAPGTRCVELDSIAGGGSGRLFATMEASGNSAKYSFKNGDVLFGRLRAYLKKYWLATFDGVCSTEIWPLIPNGSRLVNGFLFLLVQTDAFASEASISYGTHMPRSDWSVLKRLAIFLPSPEEQTAIATVLSDMDAELSALEARRDKTRSLKQAMMQELLTGKTRLLQPTLKLEKSESAQKGAPSRNIHFERSVFAAEIVERLHDEPTFGHVKFEKVIFLAERRCKVDTGSNYRRAAAGPFDNRALHSIDSQLRQQKWFDARKEGDRYRYIPMEKRGGHGKYFAQYFENVRPTFDAVIETFRTANTEQCEIVATLYGAWEDLLNQNSSASDDVIVNEVLNNWHEKKRQISEERWRKALQWMRKNEFSPVVGS